MGKKRDRRFRHDKGSFRSTCQLSLVNCQLSLVNCQLSLVNCQLSHFAGWRTWGLIGSFRIVLPWILILRVFLISKLSVCCSSRAVGRPWQLSASVDGWHCGGVFFFIAGKRTTIEHLETSCLRKNESSSPVSSPVSDHGVSKQSSMMWRASRVLMHRS